MRTVGELARALGWRPLSQPQPGEAVTGAYAGDLLSDVAAGARPGDVWLTVQLHHNVVRIAVLKDLAAVVICGDREPAGELVGLARDSEINLLRAPLPLFEAAGRLYRELAGTLGAAEAPEETEEDMR